MEKNIYLKKTREDSRNQTPAKSNSIVFQKLRNSKSGYLGLKVSKN